ncbi:hypothetical protein OG223_34585 [Streptomyces sp. NBC_01478]|uniref:hypothetical protein n=1 Tax=Streptomyces sp. NBC_01478 TaxID=2903882 RepID=UPI002E35DC19|nr:hypothetical protein [Streptomyces sp. NBC_01478]
MTIREGLSGLIHEIVEESDGDSARTCALGLMACCAAAEIEDYNTCDFILDFLLRKLDSDEDSANSLLRALLLQQRALRLRDTGRDPKSASTGALKFVNQVRVDELPPCKLGPYADFSATLNYLLVALRNAIWSLAPTIGTDFGRVSGWDGFPSRDEILKSPRPEQLIKIGADRSEAYAKFVLQTYRNLFGSRPRYILGGPEVPDIFAQALALELFGHASVRESRKELALLRLVQIDAYEQSEHVRDALRLLRHAGAYKELSLAVERFRTAGPLWALSEDARQIIQQRTGDYPLGRNELRVLRGAAELMTSAEADRALTAVCEWKQEDYVGEAWITAAALSNYAEKCSEIADFLLQQSVIKESAASGLDKDLARSIRVLDWTAVQHGVADRWSIWLRTRAQHWPTTEEAVAGVLRVQPDDSKALQDLEAVAVRLNSAIKGSPLPPSSVRRSVEIVTQELQNLVAEANAGYYSMKFRSAVDVAAALIVFAEADLWQDLAICLTDERINRLETDAAFERLSHERPPMTQAVRDLFKGAAHRILRGRTESSEIAPYPEALRFLAVYGLIDDSVIFSSVAELAGSGAVVMREQAARTLAVIAEVRGGAWISAIATQLSHDHDVSVRSHAGRALALLSEGEELVPRIIQERITQLLGEDGIAIPLRLLDAMKMNPPSNVDVKQKIEQMLSDHPSGSVRRMAQVVLDGYA